MTTLTLDLPTELYERLRAEAEHQGKPVAIVAQEWLTERLEEAPPAASAMGDTPAPAPTSDRDRSTEVLRAAGLLAELSPAEKERARRSTATLEEVSAALSRAGGKPLSELILEMRGPKE